MKIRPMEAELFHADRRTDGQKVIVAFRNFCKRVYNMSIGFGANTTSRADKYILHTRRHFVFDFYNNAENSVLTQTKRLVIFGGAYCAATVT